MASKVLIVVAACALLIGGYVAGGGGAFGNGGRSDAGRGDPERCQMLMRGFIDESRREDARNPNRFGANGWSDVGRAIIKLDRVERVLRRNGCPCLIDEKTGRGAPFRIGLPGEKPAPGVFVLPSRR